MYILRLRVIKTVTHTKKEKNYPKIGEMDKKNLSPSKYQEQAVFIKSCPLCLLPCRFTSKNMGKLIREYSLSSLIG